MKKKISIAGGLLLLYLALLLLLVHVEKEAPGASIRSFGDAFWYAIVTLTTVGYGDLFPVSVVGKIIAVVFIVSSLGLLTALIGVMVSFFSETLRPRYRLMRLRKKNWDVFVGESDEALVLAGRLREQEPDGVTLFLTEPSDTLSEILEEETGFCMPFSPQQILKIKGSSEKVRFFFFEEDGWKNYSDARQMELSGALRCCMVPLGLDEVPDDMVLYQKYQCLGRVYWQEHPIYKNDESVVLIGLGQYGENILEQGLLTNVLATNQKIVYHIYGDGEHFRNSHFRFMEYMERGTETADRLFFHKENWNDDVAVLKAADRIILCDDSDEVNWKIARELKQYFGLDQTVQLRLEHMKYEDESRAFGSLHELMDPDNVLRHKINDLAVQMNEIYRASAGGEAPTWKELSDFLRRSNQAAADHLLTKAHILLPEEQFTELTPKICSRAYRAYAEMPRGQVRNCRRIEHERWCRFHVMNNWEYAPERNNALRRHPALVAFDVLSEAMQAKDDYAWELLSEIK